MNGTQDFGTPHAQYPEPEDALLYILLYTLLVRRDQSFITALMTCH